MSTRQTSIEAYRQITDEGLLTDMGLKVYAALFNHGPATANELRAAAAAVAADDKSSLDKSLHKRLPELRDRGVARETGRRVCKISGRTCIEWDVTDGLPAKPPKDDGKALTLKQITTARYVYLPQPVRGDHLFSDTVAPTGVYRAHFNENGAVSVTADNGNRLGVKPGEYVHVEVRWA